MKIKQILKKWLINNIGYKILAVVFAFALWLAIMNIQDPTITRTISNIPVVEENDNLIAADEYVYTVKSGKTATIEVQGKRSIVNSLTASDFIAVANFEELSITNAIPITVSLTEEKARYANSISITQRTNSMILQLEHITSRSYDVSIVYDGTIKENMVIDDAVVNPAQIKVTAPVSILDSVGKIEAVVNYADIDEDVSLRAAPVIYSKGGGVIEVADEIETDCDEVTVDFDVKYTKSVPVSINVMGEPAAGYQLDNVTYSFSNVALKGSSETLKGISRISLPSSLLDITDETRDVSINVNLTEYAPEGTEVYDNNINLVITAHISEVETTATTAATNTDNGTLTNQATTQSTDSAETTKSTTKSKTNNGD